MNFRQKTALVFGAVACVAAPTFAQSNPATVVQAQVDAYRAGDLEAFVNTFSSDAVLIAEGARFVGKAQIRRVYSPNFASGAPSIYVAGSEMRDGRVVLSTGLNFADGTDVCCFISTYTVVGGKITKLEVYSPR